MDSRINYEKFRTEATQTVPGLSRLHSLVFRHLLRNLDAKLVFDNNERNLENLILNNFCEMRFFQIQPQLFHISQFLKTVKSSL